MAARKAKPPGVLESKNNPPMITAPKKASAHKGSPSPAGRIMVARMRFIVPVPMPLLIGGSGAGMTVGVKGDCNASACPGMILPPMDGIATSAFSKALARSLHEA
jgi:hypothetical protein